MRGEVCIPLQWRSPDEGALAIVCHEKPVGELSRRAFQQRLGCSWCR